MIATASPVFGGSTGNGDRSLEPDAPAAFDSVPANSLASIVWDRVCKIAPTAVSATRNPTTAATATAAPRTLRRLRVGVVSNQRRNAATRARMDSWTQLKALEANDDNFLIMRFLSLRVIAVAADLQIQRPKQGPTERVERAEMLRPHQGRCG